MKLDRQSGVGTATNLSQKNRGESYPCIYWPHYLALCFRFLIYKFPSYLLQYIKCESSGLRRPEFESQLPPFTKPVILGDLVNLSEL